VSHPPARTDLACRNCGTQAALKFCPECGQETTLHPPTLGEFLHEFVGHYVALEGTLWRTLWLLLLRPGRLTREYLDGRRRRYVLPLRLYLTASFVFFLVLKLVASNVHPEMDVKVDGRNIPVAEYEADIAAAADAASGAASTGKRPRFEKLPANACGGAGQRACSRVEASLNDSVRRLQEHPQEALEHMREHALHWAPYAIFVLLPAFAGIMLLAYRSRRMTYGEHFVFSLHLHAFWFLAGLLLVALPGAISDLFQLAVMVYGVWAMHETYGGRWWTTVMRALFIIVLYGIVLTAAITVLAIALLAAS
jgi:hypothetical protein